MKVTKSVEPMLNHRFDVIPSDRSGSTRLMASLVTLGQDPVAGRDQEVHGEPRTDPGVGRRQSRRAGAVRG